MLIGVALVFRKIYYPTSIQRHFADQRRVLSVHGKHALGMVR